MNWLLFAAILAVPRLPHGRPAQAPAPAQAAAVPEILSDSELRARIEAYLGAIDTPIGADQWRGLGPQAAPVLEPIATDENEMPSRRAKALEGLVAAAPDRAALLVGKLARDETAPTVVRVAALHGVGKVLAPSKALAELKPVLQTARTAGMRSTAADVISRTKGGCAMVHEQVARESDEHRGAYQRALARCKE